MDDERWKLQQAREKAAQEKRAAAYREHEKLLKSLRIEEDELPAWDQYVASCLSLTTTRMDPTPNLGMAVAYAKELLIARRQLRRKKPRPS